MKLQKIVTCAGLIAGSFIAVSTNPAQAFNFNSGSALGECSAVPLENLGNNTPSASPFSSCTTDDGFSLTAAAPGKLTVKQVNNVKGVGIFQDSSRANQGSQQEIDRGEFLTLSLLDGPATLKSIDLAFLYTGPNPSPFGDVVNEVAQVIAGGFTGTLSILNATTAQWQWNGITQIVNALSPSTSNGGGLYRIDNPFGDTEVSNVVFTSPVEAGTSYRYSDFAVAGAEQAEKVPEPATLAGLGLVAGALVTARRRKGSKAC